MKNIFKYLIIILVPFTISCEDELDLEPITSYSNANFWQERSHADAALTGAYNRLQLAFANEIVYYGEMRADNLEMNREDLIVPASFLNNTIDPSFGQTDWGNFYQVINQANLILKNIEEMEEKGLYEDRMDEYRLIKGEAFGLRALCYFYMLRLWGEVPLITQPALTATQDFTVPKSPIKAIESQILMDLNSAETLLPSSAGTDQEDKANIRLGAIYAMKTDYYMWVKNYDLALVNSSMVLGLNYELADLYDPDVDYDNETSLNVFLQDTEYSSMFIDGFSEESIFEIAYSYEEGMDSNLGSIYGVNFPIVNSSLETVDLYGTNDLRQPLYVNPDGRVIKFQNQVGFDNATMDDKNIIIYRLADIILLRAEALNKKGRTVEAIDLVNQIRYRAGESEYLPEDYAAMNTDEIEDLILTERRREFAFEGKRWFDLVRTGNAIEVMRPINGMSDERSLVLPINLDQIRINPLLVQNEFYR